MLNLVRAERPKPLFLWLGAGALVVLLAGLLALAIASARAGSQVSEATMDEVAKLAYGLAAQNGDADPESVTAVVTTATRAERLVYDPSARAVSDRRVVLVVARGRFVGHMAPRPPGAAPPTGTVLAIVVDPATLAITEWGISDRNPDLSSVGTPSVLQRPATS